LMFNKVTSGSYGYFFKFSYFFWYRNGILQVGQKLQKLVKKTEGILGVNNHYKKETMQSPTGSMGGFFQAKEMGNDIDTIHLMG
jgi:hypothetical protein